MSTALILCGFVTVVFGGLGVAGWWQERHPW